MPFINSNSTKINDRLLDHQNEDWIGLWLEMWCGVLYDMYVRPIHMHVCKFRKELIMKQKDCSAETICGKTNK